MDLGSSSLCRVGQEGKEGKPYTKVVIPSFPRPHLPPAEHTQLLYPAPGSPGSRSLSHFLWINFFQTELSFLLRPQCAVAPLINS